MKKLISVFLAALLLLSLAPVVFAEEAGIAALKVNPYGGEEAAMDTVSWFASGGQYFLFMPGNYDSTTAKVYFSSGKAVTLDGEEIVSGGSASGFTPGQHIVAFGTQNYAVQVLSGSSVPSVYIATESGSLSYVHANKENKEAGSIRIVDPDGTLEYNGALDYIKGRGNSTWNWAKKPYNIKLTKKTGLFGMAKSKKWCLIACYIDPSLIRNALASDLANAVGISYTPKGQHVDLYVNGEYLGVYYLTEKVEIDSSSIDIYNLEGENENANEQAPETYPLGGSQGNLIPNTIKYTKLPNDPAEITGGYLLEFEAFSRYADEPSGFVTAQMQPIVVKSPEYASRAEVEYISTYYQEFEDAMYAASGYNAQGRHYSEYIDVESLARDYILQEYLENYDGCNQSFFLYKDVNGVLTFGPAWDFDHALGLGGVDYYNTDGMDTAVPDQLYIKSCRMSGANKGVRSLLAQAYMHNDFQALVSRIWETEYAPYNKTWTEKGEECAEAITASAVMNAVRWNTYSTADVSAVASRFAADCGSVFSFLRTRFSFLQGAFAADAFYVKYVSGAKGTSIKNDNTIYHSGDPARVKSAPDAAAGSVFYGWNTKEDFTGETYQPNESITVTGNVTLYAMWDDPNAETPTEPDDNGGTNLNIWQRILAFFRNIIAFIRRLFGIAA